MLNTLAREVTEILNKPRGTQLIYHVGFLTIDRTDDNNSRRRDYDETAMIAWNLYEAGKVTLVQKKISRSVYEYFVVRL